MNEHPDLNTKHTDRLKAIFNGGESGEEATCKESLQVRTEGDREVRRTLGHIAPAST